MVSHPPTPVYMSRSLTNVKLPEGDVRWFYETYPDGKLSVLLSTLLQFFREEAEQDEAPIEDVLTRIHERIQT